MKSRRKSVTIIGGDEGPVSIFCGRLPRKEKLCQGCEASYLYNTSDEVGKSYSG